MCLHCCMQAFSGCGTQDSPCDGFSCCGAWAQYCGARAQLLLGMWNLLRPGIEPVSPALAGGFLTTGPPGKSQLFSFVDSHKSSFVCIEVTHLKRCSVLGYSYYFLWL